MAGIRALQRRIKRIEEAEKPRPSPFTLWFGSFDAWVECEVLPGVENGTLEPDDMIEVVAALRNREDGKVWEQAYAC